MKKFFEIAYVLMLMKVLEFYWELESLACSIFLGCYESIGLYLIRAIGKAIALPFIVCLIPFGLLFNMIFVGKDSNSRLFGDYVILHKELSFSKISIFNKNFWDIKNS